MDEAARPITEYFEKKANVMSGIIVGLHTFGSRVTHVHMLVTMGGMTKEGEWKEGKSRIGSDV